MVEKTVHGHGAGSYASSQYDIGLRKYLSGVFAYMSGALMLSALVAFAVANITPVAALVLAHRSNGLQSLRHWPW